MKKILITGVNSYIGNSFDEYIKGFSDYSVEKVSFRDDSWKKIDFSLYDAVLHVAGIAHSDNGKISQEKEKLYYKINTDLSYEIAKNCKNNTHFIYMSSIIIFGESASIGKNKIIDKNTKPNPINAYGDSKLQAENKLLEIDGLKLSIIRPPMVYGKNSKGNYPLLSKIAKHTPIFPDIINQRSMIYIENLCEFIRLIIENQDFGIFMPQNLKYITTTSLVVEIANVHNKKIIKTKIFNIPLKILANFMSVINKAFGSLAYDEKISEYTQDYNIINFEQSIKRTENEKSMDI